jgi:peptide/nickel transport system permease protein
MSSITAAAPANAAPATAPTTPSRTLLQQAVRDTLVRWGARIGITWVIILAFFAIFGPLIASSFPYLMKSADGQLSSPLWEHLTAVDLAVLSLPFTYIIGRLAGRFAGVRLTGPRLAILVLAVALAIYGIAQLKTAPRIVDYTTWRAMAQDGRAAWVITPPIPFSPADYSRDVPKPYNRPPTWSAAATSLATTEDYKPAAFHWLGSDRDGADVASRIVHSCRNAMIIGFIATGIAVTIGIIVGALMGYFAGWIDILMMRVIEMFEAIPRLMLLLALAAIFGADIYLIVILIGLTGWTGDARFIRAEFLRLRKLDFVQAAVAVGLPLRSVLFKHMLPNGITPVLVSSSFGVASAILLESTLAFLGLSKAEQPSWGQLLNQARSGGTSFYWWIAIFPGLMIFLTVFSYTLIGEAIRDAIDPKLKKRQ